MVLTATYNYIVYNHLCGCYRPNKSRQMRGALRTVLFKVLKLRVHSATEEVHTLFFVRIAKNTFLCSEIQPLIVGSAINMVFSQI